MNGKKLGWLYGGLLLGSVLAIAMIVIKPVGASTQFVILDGIIWDSISPIVSETTQTTTGYTSENSYLAKNEGAYAKKVANPFSYSLIFAISIAFGGLLSRYTMGPKITQEEKSTPTVWMNRFGKGSSYKRYIMTFTGGLLILFGSRLASGCTSGHMMSGMMQTSVSGYFFAFGVFLTAVPTSILFYMKKEK